MWAFLICFSVLLLYSVLQNKKFSVGWSMSWGSEGHFDFQEALKMVKISVDIFYTTFIYNNVLSWEVIGINWIDIMNLIFKKWIIHRSYPNIHLHINYVRLFQEIYIYFDRPRHPNGRQWPITPATICNAAVYSFLVVVVIL